MSIVSSDEDDFFDALEDNAQFEEAEFEVVLPLSMGAASKIHKRSPSGISNVSMGSEGAAADDSDSGSDPETLVPVGGRPGVVARLQPAQAPSGTARVKQKKKRVRPTDDVKGAEDELRATEPPSPQRVSRRKRRNRISNRPNMSLNLWHIMKNCIGKELTKIPMPVNFNEPISTLQRITEEFEYSDILHRASKCDDPCEQMTYVAAFTVSPYSTTVSRTGKPFNPLLGETYECDRTDDLGWRALAEQVSHHPPTAAQHTEGQGWTLYQEFTMSSKFRGKYLQITPLGIAHLEFHKTGHHYTWHKVTTTVHNFIVGKLWIDNSGEMDIVEHKTKTTCHLKYHPYSYFSREPPRKVTGVVGDCHGQAKYVLTGTWDDRIECAKVTNSIISGSSSSKPVLETGQPHVIWLKRGVPIDSEKMYNFTRLTIELNEPEAGVAPTDSRLRPDQRLMEDGQWDLANETKVKLEEKQRAARRQREADAEKAAAEGRAYHPYEPVWFKKEQDEFSGSLIHKYQGQYWEAKKRQDWSPCPDIYL